MLIGYARISTPSQSINLQIDALIQAGCDKNRIFTDIASGSKTARPGLDKALDYAREGDILEFRLKRSDSAKLSGAEFAFHNEWDEMDRVGKSSQ